MKKPSEKTTVLDAYRVPGFQTRVRVDGYDLQSPAFVITLDRRSKKRRGAAAAANDADTFMISAGGERVILAAGIEKFISILRCAV